MATIHGRDILGYVDIAATRDGKVLGLKLRLIADIGAYNMLLTAHGAHPHHVDGKCDLRHPGDPCDGHRGLHEQDADRLLSRRRPPGGYLLRRARDGHARARAEHGPGRSAAQELHPAAPVPLPDPDGRRLRLGRLRKGAGPRAAERGMGALESGTGCGQSGGKTRRPWPVDVRRSVRDRPVRAARDRWLGAFAGHGRARRPHQRDDRRVAARPGERDHVRPDARGSVRRSARTHHDPPRRHRHREARDRHVRQPLSGGGRRRASHGRPQSESENGEVRRRRCWKRTRTTSFSRTA